MRAKEFHKWCIDNGGQTRVSAVFDLHINTVHNYCNGRQPVPELLSLAIYGMKAKAMHALLAELIGDRINTSK